MNRRSFLAAGCAALSGCASVGYQGDVDGAGAPATPIAGGQQAGLAEYGFPATICEEEPYLEGIRAIEEAAFGVDWSDVDVPERYRRAGGLAADSVVIGLTDGDRARAYPLDVLEIHEVVNDRFGAPILVTYCPICRSGMVARRVVDGEPTGFGVSGLLWQPPSIQTAGSEQEDRVFGVGSDGIEVDVRNSGNLVLYDAATGSYWSQLLARAICGPRRGDDLEIVPSTVTTWGEWRDEHPDSRVLLPPPASSIGNPPYPE